MKPYLKLEAVQKALNSYDNESRQAAALACRYLDPPQSVLEEWAHFAYRHEHVAAALYGAGGDAPLKWIKQVLRRGDHFAVNAAIWAIKERQRIPLRLLPELLRNTTCKAPVINELAERCRGRKIPYRQLKQLMLAEGSTHITQLFLGRIAEWDRRIPDDLLWEHLIMIDPVWTAAQAALANALRVRGVTDDEIQRRYREAQNHSIDERDMRSRALFALMKGHGPLDLIVKELIDYPYSLAAAKATTGMDIDLKILERWRFSGRKIFQTASMYASVGREDVPAEWIESLLMRGSPLPNNGPETRLEPAFAARLAAFNRRDIPPIRTIEPKCKVHKYCIGGVQVFGRIPETAEVRCSPFDDYHSIRVDQVDVIRTKGTFFGESIGIARQDSTTLYRPGQRTKVTDFDPRDACCLPGLHFYLPQD